MEIKKICFRKKIFVISQSDIVDTIGGAITSFNNFCKLLFENNYDVYAICEANSNQRPFGLREGIKFINLKYYGKHFKSFSKSINALIKDENPDMLVYFFPSLYNKSKLKKDFDKIPRILMFRSRPDFYFACDNKMEENLKPYYKNTKAQVLFDSYKNLLPKYMKDNSICIPNFAKNQKKFIDNEIEHKKIVYLSRIDNCKGLEFLINSFNIIASKYKDWSIDIWGQGKQDYLDELINLTKKLKLDKQIHFKGITKAPIENFLKYDFCVFPSFFEGFPMGLIEAQSVGLPCLGLCGCSGVNELIIDNYNGLLAQRDYKDFALKIEKLITNKETRKEFSQNTIKEVQKYNEKEINKMWLNAIEDSLNGDFRADTNQNSVKNKYELFPVQEMAELTKKQYMQKFSFLEKIFSIKKKIGTDKKIIHIFGIKITRKNKK